MKFVINKISKQLRCCGTCDFEQDGSFDPTTEQIIEKDLILDPPLEEQTRYWNEAMQEFQTTPI